MEDFIDKECEIKMECHKKLPVEKTLVLLPYFSN